MMKKIITNSEISCFRACPQKWMYRYKIGYRPGSGMEGPALMFGKAIHAGLEAHYKGGSGLEVALAVEAEYYGDKLAANPAQCILSDYLEHYAEVDFRAAQSELGPEVELEFRIPIFTPSGHRSKLFEIAGKIDLVVEIRDEIWIVDHKTRAKINGESDAARLAIDRQARLYCWAYYVTTGVRPAGFIYNLIRSKPPSIPRINKDGSVSIQACDTTAAIFEETVRRHNNRDFPEKYLEQLEKLRFNKFFFRVPRRYTEEDMKEIQLELYQIAMDMHRAEQTGFYMRNDTSCDHYAGCSYRNICMGLSPEGLVIGEEKHAELEGVPLKYERRGYDLRLWRPGSEVDAFDEVSEGI